MEERQRVTSVQAAFSTARDWALLRAGFAAGGVQVVLSNTGDAGYQGFDTDSAAQLAASAAAPRGFPAKLLVLLRRSLAARARSAADLAARRADLAQWRHAARPL